MSGPYAEGWPMTLQECRKCGDVVGLTDEEPDRSGNPIRYRRGERGCYSDNTRELEVVPLSDVVFWQKQYDEKHAEAERMRRGMENCLARCKSVASTRGRMDPQVSTALDVINDALGELEAALHSEQGK